MVRKCFQKVALDPPSDNSFALDWFLGFCWPLSASRVAHITLLSQALYALYRVHGSVRHGRVHQEDMLGAFQQHFHHAGIPEAEYEAYE